jgi:hypothetical protein
MSVDRSRLHHAPAVHDHDLVGHVGYHAEVVRDQQHRHVEFLLQILDELQDLRLDGDVERGGGLIGDQQRRAADQRHGDHGALAQAAGKLERIGVLGLDRVGEADPPQHVDHRVAPLGLAHLAVQRERLADLVADGVQRRERRHRLLEDDRDAPAADVLHLAPRRVQAGDVVSEESLGSLKTISPDSMRAMRGRIPMIDCATTDLPEPDSPTSATVPPAGMRNDTPSTALTVPASTSR